MKKSLQAGLLKQPQIHKFDTVEIGPIEIKDNKFFAMLVPEYGQSAFAIRLFGFTPIVNKGKSKGKEKELMQRLKGLGYID